MIRLTVDTWNPSTEPLWRVFTANRPGLEMTYIPGDSAAFDDELLSRLEQGTAGDVIGCRPYDRSLTLFEAGHLADLSDLDTPLIPDFAYAAWSDSSGRRYCVPVSSVAFGFLYNTEIFAELGLTPPTTITEFEEVLEAIYVDGSYVPIALGSENPARLGDFLLSNLGPAFWGGEDGRLGLASDELKVTDTALPELFELVARWSKYLPDGHELVDPVSASELFIVGDAAIRPVGSWVLREYNDVTFEIGVFPAPGRNPGDPCVIVSPLDFAFGMNPATEHPEEVRSFLEFVASEQFGVAFAEIAEGQYSLQRPVPPSNEGVGQEIADLLDRCEPSLRLPDTGYGENTGAVLDTLRNGAVGLVTGSLSPDEMTTLLQESFDQARS